MSKAIEHFDRGMTDTIELLNILKWKYDFHENENRKEFDCIKEITNHKGNWSIVFKEKPTIKLVLTIVLVFDTILSYDGLESLKYNETIINDVAGCLAMNQKKKIIQALEICN